MNKGGFSGLHKRGRASAAMDFLRGLPHFKNPRLKWLWLFGILNALLFSVLGVVNTSEVAPSTDTRDTEVSQLSYGAAITLSQSGEVRIVEQRIKQVPAGVVVQGLVNYLPQKYPLIGGETKLHYQIAGKEIRRGDTLLPLEEIESKESAQAKIVVTAADKNLTPGIYNFGLSYEVEGLKAALQTSGRFEWYLRSASEGRAKGAAVRVYFPQFVAAESVFLSAQKGSFDTSEPESVKFVPASKPQNGRILTWQELEPDLARKEVVAAEVSFQKGLEPHEIIRVIASFPPSFIK